MSPADQHKAHSCPWCVTRSYGSVDSTPLFGVANESWPHKKWLALEHGWIELTEYAGFLLPCSKHRPADGGTP